MSDKLLVVKDNGLSGLAIGRIEAADAKTMLDVPEVDSTLSIAGAAADAAAAGDLSNVLYAGKTRMFVQGGISSTSGVHTAGNTRISTSEYVPSDVRKVGVNDGYKFVLMAYDNGTFVGVWNGTDYQKGSAVWWTEEVSLSKAGNHDYSIVLANTNDSEIDPSYGGNVVFTGKSDLSLSNIGKAADAKTVGDDLAPAYDPTATYFAKDYVLYNGDIFVCVTNISTPEEWNEDHWASTTLGTGLSSVQQAVDIIRKIQVRSGLTAEGLEFISKSGNASDYFDIGDVVYIPWTDLKENPAVEYQYPFIIADINTAQIEFDGIHQRETRPAAIWLMAMYAYPGEKIKFGDNSKWSESSLYNWLNNTETGFFAGIDSEWKNEIKKTAVCQVLETRAQYGGWQAEYTEGKVFIMSARQAYGNASSGVDDYEGTAFQYWKDVLGFNSPSNGTSSSARDARKIAVLGSDTTTSANVFLRSKLIGSEEQRVFRINNAGYIDSTVVTTRTPRALPCMII